MLRHKQETSKIIAYLKFEIIKGLLAIIYCMTELKLHFSSKKTAFLARFLLFTRPLRFGIDN